MTITLTERSDKITQLLEPRADHDNLTFKELQSEYNFRNVSERRRVFSNLIVHELSSMSNPTVLDIGCGNGMARDNSWQWAIKPYTGQYWGIEPDPGVAPAEGLFDQTHAATMETAELPDNSIDLAYSWMVMEHVENPEAFCERLYRALKPGGTYYFSTPNINHYFTLVARFMRKLRIDECALSMVYKQEKLDEYHYPVQYKFNSEAAVSEVAQNVGFSRPEFAYVEVEGPIKYFPGPTKLIFHSLAWKRTIIRRSNLLLTMIGRLSRPNQN